MSKSPCNACSAPICPQQGWDFPVWFPGEDVCRREDFQQFHLVKVQKALARAGADRRKYFSVPMLEAVSQVHKGMEGLSPDPSLREARKNEEAWVEALKKGRELKAGEG